MIMPTGFREKPTNFAKQGTFKEQPSEIKYFGVTGMVIEHEEVNVERAASNSRFQGLDIGLLVQTKIRESEDWETITSIDEVFHPKHKGSASCASP